MSAMAVNATSRRPKPYGQLAPLLVPSRPRPDFSMDFIVKASAIPVPRGKPKRPTCRKQTTGGASPP